MSDTNAVSVLCAYPLIAQQARASLYLHSLTRKILVFMNNVGLGAVLLSGEVA
jgi:hypothetical protein